MGFIYVTMTTAFKRPAKTARLFQLVIYGTCYCFDDKLEYNGGEYMNWEEVLMGGIIGAIVATIAVFLSNVWVDIKGWKKVKNLIGNLNGTTLGRQHEDIRVDIKQSEYNISKTITERSTNIYSKVDNIDKEIYANKERYENLKLDQREIKNNLDKLILEWQDLIKENRELKKEVEYLREQHNKLLNKERRAKKNREYER